MTYGELKPIICAATVIAFDAYDGKMLFDTMRSKKGKDEEYRNRNIAAIWVGSKKRANSGFPLTDTDETVLCLYLSRDKENEK